MTRRRIVQSARRSLKKPFTLAAVYALEPVCRGLSVNNGGQRDASMVEAQRWIKGMTPLEECDRTLRPAQYNRRHSGSRPIRVTPLRGRQGSCLSSRYSLHPPTA